MKQTLPKLNLILIAVSFVIIISGFFLMVGEPSGEVYNADIFSFRRIFVWICEYVICYFISL